MKRLALLIGVAAVVAAGSVAALAAGAGAQVTDLPVITLTMNAHSIVVGGTPVSGAVKVVLTVSGEPRGQAVLVHLNPGVTPQQAFGQVQSHHGDLNALDGYASIVFDYPAPKGTSRAQTRLVPGNYVALEMASHGTPPNAQFTVSPSAHPASLPKPNAIVAAIDFGFTGPGTLHKGWLVRFKNDGYVVHMFDWIKVKNSQDASTVMSLLRAGKDNAAQKYSTGGGEFLGPASHRALQQLVVHENPGTYVLACFMNTEDGREHTQLGMEREIKIVK